MVMRNELTEEQMTNLMRSIPRAEEADRLRAEIERLRKAMTNMMIGWRHIRREREEYRAEVEKLRSEIERLKQEPELLRAELISLANAARNALADAYDRARECKP